MFFEILPVRWENWLWKWTQVVKNGQKQFFYKKLNNFTLGPTRELIFPLDYSSLVILTENNHPRPGSFLTLNNYDKVYIAKNYIKKTACNDLLILFYWSLWQTWLIIEV